MCYSKCYIFLKIWDFLKSWIILQHSRKHKKHRLWLFTCFMNVNVSYFTGYDDFHLINLNYMLARLVLVTLTIPFFPFLLIFVRNTCTYHTVQTKVTSLSRRIMRSSLEHYDNCKTPFRIFTWGNNWKAFLL